MKFTAQIKGISYNTIPGFKCFMCLFSFAVLARLLATLDGTSCSSKEIMETFAKKNSYKENPTSMSLYSLLVILLFVVHLQPRCITQIYSKQLNCISLIHKPDAFVIDLPPPLPLYSQDILWYVSAYGTAPSGLWGSAWLPSGAQQKEMKQTRLTFSKQTLVVFL